MTNTTTCDEIQSFAVRHASTRLVQPADHWTGAYSATHSVVLFMVGKFLHQWFKQHCKLVSAGVSPKTLSAAISLTNPLTFYRTYSNRTQFAKYSARINIEITLISRDSFYTFVFRLLCSVTSTFIILPCPQRKTQMQFLFVLAHILNNSWCG